MIRSFADAETARFWETGRSRRMPADLRERAMAKLVILDAAPMLESLKVPPGNHLEALKGDRKGQHSIRINQQWRICFRWLADGPHEVAIVDYH